ncbi:ubiquitin-like small modifier protein 1 [Halobaculum lipolyticum]|uniref:Ubiquitin-like small modifier protein 1 n=1 Tax=Halobaculum lipolyticum TaxID=3032001 RepID=A0ABD5WFE7_9EURY|nr:ubiquitin-like small modifier protein 1 [Halobaculum sp. DT31]
MELTLKFFATFREAVGSKVVAREFADADTVGDVLAALEAEYEGLAGNLLVDGDLKPQINVLLNGREVLHMQGVETNVDDGDTLSVFPPVAGGEGPADPAVGGRP